MSELNEIEIKGARVHNLKNVSLKFPKNKLVVFTGLSGSGKSSLAFDTLYAEGQRRYVESLSSYARQFLGIMDKPDVDSITGLSPAISIDQKSSSHSPRSTVGTVTEIYDYLRLLYAKVGKQHCPICGNPVFSQSLHEIRESILNLGKNEEKKLYILAPLVKQRKGTYQELFSNLKSNGFVRVRVDGSIYSLDEDIKLDKNIKHNIEVVIDRLVVGNTKKLPEEEQANLKKRIIDSLETATNQSGGEIIVAEESNKDTWKEHFFSEENYCPIDDIYLEEITPASFSFNSPQGACEKCNGIGFIREIDKDLLYNPRLTIREGGIFPWAKMTTKDSWHLRLLESMTKEENFDLNTRIGDYPDHILDLILYGAKGKKYVVQYTTQSGHTNTYTTGFEGIIPNLERRYQETNSDYIRAEIEKYMRDIECPECHGHRLKPFALAVKVAESNISEIVDKSIDEALTWTDKLMKNDDDLLTKQQYEISRSILKEVHSRLNFLTSVGLNYLTLARSARTLSGGESQRIRLASQIGTGLTGVLYVLDEPSIGLHQRDNIKLINTLKGLRDLGNTVVVVEHDEETMLESDWIIDIGPGAGEHGGEIVFNGEIDKLLKSDSTVTAEYLKRKKIVGEKYLKEKRHDQKESKEIVIHKATENNLKGIDVKIPLNKFVAVTGISGSGKSTLINEILYKNLVNTLQNGKQIPGRSQGLSGIENLDKVVNIDQSPIGRTPRSNPATYTGVFTHIRNLFAELPESRARGYGPGRFSFNVKSGRCANCEGDGVIKIEMQFLADVYVECEVCQGKRYNEEVLQIDYKGKNISDVLNMRVEEALKFFEAIPIIRKKLETIDQVGLSYVQLGQPATQLSGGEAQRVKLATELAKSSRGHTLYILDEPTTGLHFSDIDKLLEVLHKLVDKENSVLVIEHNLDVIKTADWIIDLGPEGGDAGGKVIFEGTVDEIIKDKDSWTGKYLKEVVDRDLSKK